MWRIFLLVLLFLAGLVDGAWACNRCGLFGNRCRYAAAYVAPVAYRAVESDIFIVNNNYPAPLVAQGNTLYAPAAGYQAAVAPLLDPNLYFSQEMQLLEAAAATNDLRSKCASALFQRALELQTPVAEKLAAGTAAKLVLDAAGLNTTTAPLAAGTGVYINRDAYGRVQVQQLTTEQIQKLNTKIAGEENVAPVGKWPTLAKYCYKCHGLDVAEPKGGFYMGADPNVAAAMRDNHFKITQMLRNGKMPPPGAPQPADDDKRAIIDEIEGIILQQLETSKE